MLIAKVENRSVVDVADSSQIFPNVSFPASGPNEEFMIDNGCMYVKSTLPYDDNTQKLVSVQPYIVEEDPLHWVCTVEVQPLTPEEIAERQEAERQSNKGQAEMLLQQTDWTATIDINNPEYSNPYLGNQPEFLAYRSQVRQIAINPPVTVEAWPVKPEEVWIDIPTA